MNAPHGSLGKGYSAAGNMVSPGNFAPVSVVGTGNLAHVSQTPVEQPEETVPQYSETPTPFYLNQVRNRSPGKSPASARSISAGRFPLTQVQWSPSRNQRSATPPCPWQT